MAYSLFRFKRWLGRLYARMAARTSLQKIHRALYIASLKGMGIRNFDHEGVLTGEKHLIEQFRRTAPAAATIFDVGANAGDYTEMVLAELPKSKVYSFEPNPVSCRRIVERFADDVRVTPIQMAMGAERGKVALYDSADAPGARFATLYEGAALPGAVAMDVDIGTLDEFVAERGIEHIHLLKIDTEGHELSVLTGARRILQEKIVDVIQFEFNSMHVVSHIFVRDIRGTLSGYTLLRLLPQGVVVLDDTDVVFEEIFAFQNIVAVQQGHPLLGLL